MSDKNFPQNIVIGASKCGTTALYYYLLRHPDVFLPVKKELHYHSSAEIVKRTGGNGDKFMLDQICKTQAAYEKFFKDAPAGAISFDISPSYLFYPDASISSIKSAIGDDVRIICFVKHPVEKVVSQYTHLLSAGRETLTFEDALAAESQRKEDGYSDMWLLRESGHMYDSIQDYKKAFKNVLVIHSEDLMKDLKGTLDMIFDFCGIDKTKFDNYEPVSKNFSGVPKSKLVSQVFIKPNLFTNFLRKIVPSSLGRIVRDKINSLNKGKKYEVDQELFKRLEAEFKPEIDNLNLIIQSKTKIKFKYL